MVTYSVIPQHYDDRMHSITFSRVWEKHIYLQRIGFGFSAFLSDYLSCRATCDSSWGLSPELATCSLAHVHLLSTLQFLKPKGGGGLHGTSAVWGTLPGETQPESFWGYCSASRSFLSGLYVQTAPTQQLRQYNKFRLLRRVLKRNTAKFSLQAI